MKLSEIKEKIENGELGIFRELYSDLEEAKKRFRTHGISRSCF